MTHDVRRVLKTYGPLRKGGIRRHLSRCLRIDTRSLNVIVNIMVKNGTVTTSTIIIPGGEREDQTDTIYTLNINLPVCPSCGRPPPPPKCGYRERRLYCECHSRKNLNEDR